MPPKSPLRIPRNSPTTSKPKIFTPPPSVSLKAAPKAHPKTRPPSHASAHLPPPPPNSQFRRNLFSKYTKTGGTIFFSLCAFLFIRDHVVSIDTVRGSSMAPTLSPDAHETGQNDKILIRRDVGRMERFNEIGRGDVVTFWKPHRPEEISIKRVIAVSGDTVYPRRGYALDTNVTEAKRFGFTDGLVQDGSMLRDEEAKGKVLVPHGHVWVEGDNWRKSYDSNDFGPISRGLIDGKAVRVWRGWWDWRAVGDGRERGRGSRVVQGVSKVPEVFVE